jgi:hypothetical protein
LRRPLSGFRWLIPLIGCLQRWRRPRRQARPPGRRGEIFRFGLLMTALAAVVVLAVALPYWALIGEP